MKSKNLVIPKPMATRPLPNWPSFKPNRVRTESGVLVGMMRAISSINDPIIKKLAQTNSKMLRALLTIH